MRNYKIYSCYNRNISQRNFEAQSVKIPCPSNRIPIFTAFSFCCNDYEQGLIKRKGLAAATTAQSASLPHCRKQEEVQEISSFASCLQSTGGGHQRRDGDSLHDNAAHSHLWGRRRRKRTSGSQKKPKAQKRRPNTIEEIRSLWVYFIQESL